MYQYEVLVESIGTSPCNRCPASCPWIQGDPKIVTVHLDFEPLGKGDSFPPKPVVGQDKRQAAMQAYARVDGLIESFEQLTGLTMDRNAALHLATTREECRFKCKQISGHLGCVFRAIPMPEGKMTEPKP